MADDTVSEVSMEVESRSEISDKEVPENGGAKRSREETKEPEEKEDKRAKIEDEKSGEGKKIDNSINEEEKTEEQENNEEKKSVTASVGPKTFASSVEMFDYFYKLLHTWTPDLNLNKYEHLVLVELLKKGHLEAERKIGKGIKAFQVRFHPQYKSRCFFLIREDESVDDFSFRKCVDHILPLPENMHANNNVNKTLRGKGGGRGFGRGRGRGRGGK